MPLHHKGQKLIPKSYRNEDLMSPNSHHLLRGLICRDLTQLGAFHTFSSLLCFAIPLSVHILVYFRWIQSVREQK